MVVHIPVSVGELLDKILILELKLRRIPDEAKRANVRRELRVLTEVWEEAVPEPGSRIHELREALAEVNETLWDVEDALRTKEAEGVFDEEFVYLARRVYLTNDRRAELKRQLNVMLGSDLVEEKSYAPYASAQRATDGGERPGAANR